MRPRLNLADATVLPFQFPSLKEGAAPPQDAAVPVPLPANGKAPDEPETTVTGIEQAAAALAAELSRASEEGMRLGFEEGRERGYSAGFAEGAAAGEAMLAQDAERLAAIVGRFGVRRSR